MIGDSLKLIEGQARAKGIAIQSEFHIGDQALRLDPDRLSQVLLNVFLNGIDAMQAGGRLTIMVDNTANRRRLEIRVSDTGSGIQPEDLPNVFEPYFTTKPSGTGLGLAIARNIMEAMEARLP